MIITIAHSKGGVGKSTISWHLIFILLQLSGHKVRVVDLDFQQTIYFLNKIRQSKNRKGIENLYRPKSGGELLEILNDDFDGYTIIDSGGFDIDLNRLAMKHSDMVIVPILNEIMELIGFQTFKNIIGTINIKNIYMLLNNVHANTKDFSEIQNAIKNVDAQVFDTIIRRNSDIKKPLKQGKHILEELESNTQIELIALAKEIMAKKVTR
jgi:chromosome partitioning protein